LPKVGVIGSFELILDQYPLEASKRRWLWGTRHKDQLYSGIPVATLMSVPHAPGEMVVAEALDFPGAVTQGFDLPDARLMITSALEDIAQLLLEEGKPLPVPREDAQNRDADLIELVPLSVHAGAASR
jgi:predicted RNase H-like HicB family nuclease